MQRITMHVDGTRFALASGQDAAAIEERVVQALRDDVGLVTVRLRGGQELAVVVSRGVPITFQTEEVADGDSARDDAPLEFPDVDGYLDD